MAAKAPKKSVQFGAPTEVQNFNFRKTNLNRTRRAYYNVEPENNNKNTRVTYPRIRRGNERLTPAAKEMLSSTPEEFSAMKARSQASYNAGENLPLGIPTVEGREAYQANTHNLVEFNRGVRKALNGNNINLVSPFNIEQLPEYHESTNNNIVTSKTLMQRIKARTQANAHKARLNAAKIAGNLADWSKQHNDETGYNYYYSPHYGVSHWNYNMENDWKRYSHTNGSIFWKNPKLGLMHWAMGGKRRKTRRRRN